MRICSGILPIHARDKNNNEPACLECLRKSVTESLLETGQSRDVAAMDGPVLFWSPDSRFIAFQDQGKLRRIDAAGGPAQTVTDLPGPGALACGAWSPDDVIVFSQGARGLFRVPAGGGAPVQITAPNQARHEYSQLCPSLLPDGRHFVYLAVSKDEGKSAIHLGSLDLKPEQQNSQPLVASNSQAVYTPSADPGSGFLLFIREGNLMALAFDARRMETKGQPAPVAAQVSPRVTGAIWVPFSASSNGLVGFAEDGKGIRQLNWYDRDGQFLGTAGPPDLYQIFALSPDGTRAAVIKGPPNDRTRNIWLVDFSRGGASTRFTSGSLADGSPVWSPDGSRIVFSSNRDGPFNLYQRLASGVKSEEVLLKSAENKTPTSWSPDGRFLLYSVANSKTKSDIWVLPMSGGGTPMPFLVTEFNEATARFSPDGHFVAYTSNESGQSEVYVRSFSLNPSGTAVETGGKWPVSPGYQPRWRRDGRELFYTSSAGKLMAVEIETKPAFRVGSPHMLPVPQTGFDQVWDVTADGKRFLRLAEPDGPNPCNVIVNWQAGLKK
jgi:Tol biopolymer transport system component